jgi:hypothetical protein
MKASWKQRGSTPGKLIETVYRMSGNGNAKGMIRLAFDAHVITFPNRQHTFAAR